MELLTAVFSRLLSMALMALPVMGVVLLARLALTRAPGSTAMPCGWWWDFGWCVP